MGFFDFENAHTKVTKRMTFIQDLAKKLDANYIKGYERVKNKFNIKDTTRGIEDSNVIVGEIQGYEYCFIEYYHESHSKNDHSRWVSKVFLRLNKYLPNFKLSTKSSAYFSIGCCVVIGLFLLVFLAPLLINIGMIFLMLFRGNLDFSSQILSLLGFGIFALIPSVILWFVFSHAFKTYREINNQGKYNIFNAKFREKYCIFSDADAESIRSIFNENVVSKIVNCTPEISVIECENNCISSDFGSDEQLSYNLCNKYLAPLLKQAKILEGVD